MPDIIQKNFSNAAKKDIQYLGKDFATLKAALINYSKTYFPKTYKDYSDASPGMLYMEQAAYVGDVLSYYMDYQFKEGIFPYTQELQNVIPLAKYLGYKPYTSKAATTTLSVYQLVPATTDTNGNYVPDTTYCLNIREYMEVKNSSNVNYVTLHSLDFSVNSGLSPRVDTVYSRDSYGVPTFFLLQKNITAISGQIVTGYFTVNNASQFYKLTLPENNVIQVLNVTDSDNNRWYEADYLAQDLIFTETDNTYVNDGQYYVYQTQVPKLIKSLKTSKKFTVNIDSNYSTYLEFGSGTDVFSDEVIFPTSTLVGVGLNSIKKLGLSLDSSTFLKLGGYGQAPSNTVLTVTYIVGGGLEANCPVGDISTVSSVNFANNISALNSQQKSLFQTVQNSLQVTNIDPATGGDGPETIEQIKQNALLNFANQDRAVTEDDYIARVYSMPPRFGSITKVCVKSDSQLNVNNIATGFVDYNNVATLTQQAQNSYHRKINYDSSNPFGLNLYVLSYDQNGNLTTLNAPTIQNLRTYLSKYRMLNDGINIIDGYIINIGVNFQILTYSTYNKQDVLNNCISSVQDFFNIDKWYFNMPINIGQLQLAIAQVEGVQSVTKLSLTNLTINDGNYSPYEYNLDQATLNNIVYPSLDPSIFEVKYSDTDIVGSCI